jgi:hypothetical protein
MNRSRTTALTPAIAAVAALALFAACNPGGSTSSSLALPSLEIPSVEIPSVALPSGLGGSLSVTGSGVSGCIDPATAALLSQVQSMGGSDIQTFLSQNKDAIATGLGTFQPSDPNLVIWRDNLIFALRAGDLTSAAAQIQMLTSGQVSIPSC